MNGNATIRAACAAIGYLCGAGALWGAGTVTLHSLLEETIDVDALARTPAPAYRLLQQSSYDRASKTPDDPEGWFANKDAGQFLRIDAQSGRQEWVLMDHAGPGVLVRSWMADRRAIPPHPPVNTKIRIYLDGAKTPAIEGHMLDLFNGTSLVPPPFGHKSLASAVSYLPIPFAKGCKITLDEPPFYYIFTFRAYAAGTKVRSFSTREFAAERATVERAGKALLAGPPAPRGLTLAIRGSLAAGGQSSASLPAGPGAVRELSLKLGSYEDPQVTRSLVLAVEFDGEQTVWTPAGEFFGTGAGLNPFRSYHRTVGEDGAMTARWVMPYRKSGRITLINHGKTPVEADLTAVAGRFPWDARSMYFHATWRHQYPVPTRPRSDWNYLQVSGQGVYVGDTLTVMNPVARWWGEGDEKIWVDDDKFPSLFGTGTEDYYGYAWGGRNRAFYEHPFHAQVRVQKYNKTWPERAAFLADTRGFSTETRTRQLDRLPFRKTLKFDMEVWHWEDCQMEYSAGTYWYALPGATSNRQPQPEEAARALPQFCMRLAHHMKRKSFLLSMLSGAATVPFAASCKRTPPNPSRAERLAERIIEHTNAAYFVGAAYIGDRLGLFKAMAGTGPLTAKQLAEKTGLHERYVLEWLRTMASASYIDYHPESQAFDMPREYAAVLVDEDAPTFSAGFIEATVPDILMVPRVLAAFKSGKGIPYADYPPEVFEGIERLTKPDYRHLLTQQWLPSVPGAVERLRAGGRLASMAIARAFPQARVFGFEPYAPSVARARENAKAAGLAGRVTFDTFDGVHIPGGPYDLITIDYSLHHAGNPIGLLRSARQALASGGAFFIVEYRKSARLEEDIPSLRGGYYGIGLLECMPTAMAEGGPGYGTGITEPDVRELAAKAGFRECARVMPEDAMRSFFVLRA